MDKTKFTLRIIVAGLFVIAAVTAGQAQIQRSYVAGPGLGNDANAASPNFCNFPTPCRNFSAAFGVTNVGGEIVALSPVGYGGLTITHAITIEAAPGQYAFIAVVPSSSGIVVNAGASDNVILRNLQFTGAPANGANSVGITLSQGKLTVENCNFSFLATGASLTKKAIIRNSNFEGNTTGVFDTGGIVDLEDVNLENNTTALSADGNGGADANPPNGPTQLRLNSGDVYNNGTGFFMNNAGAVFPSGQCNAANIFLRSASEGVRITGNSTFAAIAGTTAHNGGCSAGQVYVGFVAQQQSP